MTRKRSVPEQPAERSPELERELDSLLELLLNPEEESRKAFVAHFLATAIPATRRLLIERLVGTVHTDSEATWARAADSLAEMGAVALPAIRLGLLETRDSGLQVRLVRLLTRISRQLSPSDTFNVMMVLEMARLLAPDAAAREAVLHAMFEPHARPGDVLPRPGSAGDEGAPR
jgi:hypothetical protein